MVPSRILAAAYPIDSASGCHKNIEFTWIINNQRENREIFWSSTNKVIWKQDFLSASLQNLTQLKEQKILDWNPGPTCFSYFDYHNEELQCYIYQRKNNVNETD